MFCSINIEPSTSSIQREKEGSLAGWFCGVDYIMTAAGLNREAWCAVVLKIYLMSLSETQFSI